MNKITRRIWFKRVVGGLIFMTFCYFLVINLLAGMFSYSYMPMAIRQMAYRVFLHLYPFNSTLLIYPFDQKNIFSQENIFIGVSYLFIILGGMLVVSGNKEASLLYKVVERIKEKNLEKELSGESISGYASTNINIIENYISENKSPAYKAIVSGLFVSVVGAILVKCIFFFIGKIN